MTYYYYHSDIYKHIPVDYYLFPLAAAWVSNNRYHSYSNLIYFNSCNLYFCNSYPCPRWRNKFIYLFINFFSYGALTLAIALTITAILVSHSLLGNRGSLNIALITEDP